MDKSARRITREVKVIECQHCHKEFEAKQDHGRWPKFCSRACFEAETYLAPRPKEKACPTCGNVFLATSSTHETEDGLRKYCSTKCSREGRKTGSTFTCRNCGTAFYRHQTDIERKRTGCCSEKCRNEFYIGDRSHGWKGGGYFDTTTGVRHVVFKRDGFVSPYVGEHRVIASQSIGRILETHEWVLHLNGSKKDNRPDNLFICCSVSEHRKRVNGTLEWPKRSNLNSYK